MSAGKILWVDDEIESLGSQIMFLENKGYQVVLRDLGRNTVKQRPDAMALLWS